LNEAIELHRIEALPLCDNATQYATALLAMREAFDEMVGDKGKLYEYRGLIVRTLLGSNAHCEKRERPDLT
jgi:hypothetical protein